MELSAECIAMLELINKPAFFTKDNLIIQANEMARELGIIEGTLVSNYISVSDDETNVITKCFNDIYYTVTNKNIGVWKLYAFEKTIEQHSISSLIRAAQYLRIPVSGISSSILNIKDSFSSDGNITEAQIQNVIKELFSLHRTIRNMSDINAFLENSVEKKVSVSICSFFQELVEKMKTYLKPTGVNITYSLPDVMFYCMIDATIIERALYNMVSNSIKAGSQNINISLSKNKNILQLTITDDGCGISDQKKARLLNMFQSAPTLNSSGQGLGLGMLITHAAAVKHNGTVMISDVKPQGCKVTLTISITKGPLTIKQNPRLITTDAVGGLDPVLIEFADFLNPENYI